MREWTLTRFFENWANTFHRLGQNISFKQRLSNFAKIGGLLRNLRLETYRVIMKILMWLCSLKRGKSGSDVLCHLKFEAKIKMKSFVLSDDNGMTSKPFMQVGTHILPPFGIWLEFFHNSRDPIREQLFWKQCVWTMLRVKLPTCKFKSCPSLFSCTEKSLYETIYLGIPLVWHQLWHWRMNDLMCEGG